MDELGKYVGFEFILEEGQNPEMGRKSVEELMTLLKIEVDDLIESAYVDLPPSSEIGNSTKAG